MPKLTRLYIKSSLIYFIGALILGFMLSIRNIWNLPTFWGTLNPVYIHLFLLGWVSQLIFGVVHWMFPKFSKDKPRGSEILSWMTFVLINIGLILRIVSEPLSGSNPKSVWGWLLAASAVFQWAAGVSFVVNTWGRIK